MLRQVKNSTLSLDAIRRQPEQPLSGIFHDLFVRTYCYSEDRRDVDSNVFKWQSLLQRCFDLQRFLKIVNLEINKCEGVIVNRTKDMYAYSWKIGHTKAPPPCMHRADRPSVPKTLPCITRIWLDGQRLYLEIAYPQKPTTRPNAARPICEEH